MKSTLLQRLLRSPRMLILAELTLILLWAMWVGQDFLNFNDRIWPHGGDFPLSIQSYYQWPLLLECGACVFWNGLINGGVPAFAEMVAGFLHPLPALATLVFGVINGSKLTLLASLALAGLAQWWLARNLGFGFLPRIWSAAIAVSGGHLAGRMEIGLLGIVMSTAFGSLAIAAGLNLAIKGTRKAALLLAAMLTFALLSGQGYIQIALALAMITMVSVFVLRKDGQGTSLLGEFMLSAGLALLLSAVFLIPFAHFLPNFGKPIDTSYSASQPIEFIPLNFVVQDADFYRVDTLGKILFPAIYMNYIGWLPALLALYSLRALWKVARRITLALTAAIAVIFFVSSTSVVQILAQYLPDVMASIRYPSMLLGLTVPLILALAAAGLDQIIRLPWPSFHLPWEKYKLKISSLTLMVLLGWSMKSTFDFSQDWYTPFWPPQETRELAQKLQTTTAQWVKPPSQHYWMPDLLESRQKITGVFRPWWWKDREPPGPFLEAIPEEELAEELEPISHVSTIQIFARATNHYAFIDTPDGPIPCPAVSRGGNIDVSCDTPNAGLLTVRENSWTGWKVAVDGKPGELRSGNWLSVAAAEGKHEFEFRYRPLDAYLGIGLTIVGVLLTGWLWLRDRRFPDSY